MCAIDASSHHANITGARAERIRKHYAAKLRKSRYISSRSQERLMGLEDRELIMPKTITFNVLSADALSDYLLEGDDLKKLSTNKDRLSEKGEEELSKSALPSSSYAIYNSSLVLAGLHACGDLSATMLRTFLDCDKVKAVISIGCCYNLLSEESAEESSFLCGFPMSKGVKSTGFLLGRSARDLSCQSAERWRGLGETAGLHNFELHAFRAAFQMVLFRYHPEILSKSLPLGRQGKALRRQQNKKILESCLCSGDREDSSAVLDGRFNERSWNPGACSGGQIVEEDLHVPVSDHHCIHNPPSHFSHCHALILRICIIASYKRYLLCILSWKFHWC